jgi:phosphoesterase RecJ-like protein
MKRLDNQAYADAAARMALWKQPLLISHVKPDGDALGALYAMRSMLRTLSVDPLALVFEALPARHALFQQHGTIPVLGRDLCEADLAKVDGVLILDTCALSQLRPIADWLRTTAAPKLVVDHHLTRDDLADGYLIDESAAATCLILYDWARAVGWEIPADARDALFIGIATDTGWFRHSNTDDRVLAAAADLVTRGVVPHELFGRLYQCETPGRVRLLGAALRSLELPSGERLAVMTLTPSTIAECGATPADTEDIVNEPLRIASVAVSVLLVDQGDGLIRVSLRSKQPSQAARSDGTDPQIEVFPEIAGSQGRGSEPDVDVARVASTFGGGGHARAAGARMRGVLPDVHREIVGHLQGVLDAAPGSDA